MSARRWAGFGRSLTLTGVTAATTWAALTSWHGFVTYPAAYLGIAAGLAAVLAVLGALPGLPQRLVIALEVLTCLVVVAWTASGDPVPFAGHSPIRALGHALSAVDTYSVPLDHSQPSLTPLLVLGAAFFLISVQWLAIHLGRPPVAGLALLAVFALPAGFTGLGSSLGSFVGAAAGFLALLVLDARDHRQRWGGQPPEGSAPSAAVAGRPLLALGAAAPSGAAAIAIAALVAGVLPLPHGGLFGFDSAGGSKVTIHRPVVDMRRDLERGDDIPLVDITTDEPDPGYLRIAVLNRFTGLEWSSGDRNVSPQHRANGTVPLPAGLSSDVPRTAYDVKVQALASFASTWLPTDFPVDSVRAPGDWRYDPGTMDFIAAGDATTSNVSYSMTSLRLDYGTTGRFFQDAPPGSVPPEDADVPTSVPTAVRDLAERLTAGARTDYQKALLLQEFFRVTGHFRYSLQRAPGGSLGQSLTTFLTPGPDGRVGYCEQFASAMALMARIVGVPARVAVGFLAPDRLGPRRWEYSSHDLHAWPELYFADAGWVRFEPTPSTRAPDAPAYTTVPVSVPHQDGGAGSDPTSRPSSVPSDGPSGRPTTRPHVPPPTQRATHTETGASSGGTPVWLLSLLAGLVLVGAAGAAPALVRRRQRARRLGSDPERAWAEVRATAVDLGLPWPAGRSARQIADGLETALGPDAAPALWALVDLVEQVRYAPGERAAAVRTRTDVASTAAEVVAGLEAAANARQRRVARWLPRSLTSR